MKTKTLEMQLPIQMVKDIIIAHLYAISYLNDDQEVKEVKFKRGIDLKNVLSFDLTITQPEPHQTELFIEDNS
jgi:hypothetical protein